jgi:hypothetical protein
MDRGVRPLLVMAALAAPALASADFRCEQALQLHASYCASSQITSVPQAAAAAVCAEYTQKLAEACRPDWDKFKSCEEFAGRFEKLLVRTCEAHKVGKKPCADWGEAYAVSPLGRCQRGKTTY